MVIFCLAFTAFLLINPKAAANAVKSGLVFFGGVLVPSLFPITFITSFVMKSIRFTGAKGKRMKPFFILFFSLIGGYTVGAKLIGDAFKSKGISEKCAQTLSLFCTNAGVGFCISVVGAGVLNSLYAGVLLYLCNIVYSVVGFIIFLPEISNSDVPETAPDAVRISDVFCETVGETAQVLLKIGGFTAIFSAVNLFLNELGIGFLSLFFEITTAVNKTRNLPLLALLLGFGGISVIFQVLSVAEKAVDIKSFLISRVCHGLVSFGLMSLASRLFKISVPVFALSSGVSVLPFFDRAAVSLSAVVSVIMLILSLESKNRGGNLREDLLQ